MRRPPGSIDRFVCMSENNEVEIRIGVHCGSVGGCHGQRFRSASGGGKDCLLVRANGLSIGRYHVHLTLIKSSD